MRKDECEEQLDKAQQGFFAVTGAISLSPLYNLVYRIRIRMTRTMKVRSNVNHTGFFNF